MKDRPLGLRDSFANLCVKCSMKVLKPRITQIFDGTNYALAGSNKMSELISLSSSHLKTNPEHDNIFIDLPNAFNECSRLNAANEIMTRCPELAKLFGLFYKNDSKVWLREENENWRAFATEEGCVQGCVMGPLVFGFATIALYEKVQKELRNKENSLFKAYSDDSFIGASHDDAVAAFKVFKEEAEASNNLKINFGPNKTCVLLGRCDTKEEAQQRVRQYSSLGFPAENIKVHPDNEREVNEFGYIHLGIPVGSKEYCTVKLDQLIEKFTNN